jgi:hypothetical protein
LHTQTIQQSNAKMQQLFSKKLQILSIVVNTQRINTGQP